jgi:hypothetical protein
MQWQLLRSVQSLHVPLHLNSAIELSLLSFDVQNCFVYSKSIKNFLVS